MRPRAALAERLEARRGEIEQAALTRVNAIADPSEAADPGYIQGLREAVAAALDYALAAIGRGDERGPPIPVALRAQARIAARNAVTLDTVLRRYFAGYSLLGYFLIEEASRDGLMSGAELQRLLGAQAGVFDRLLEAIAEEHTRESQTHRASSDRRRAEQIERLLAGEPLDTSDLDYDFDAHHLGLVASGPEAHEALREPLRAIDCRLLLVRSDRATVWAWLGSRRPLEPADVLDSLRTVGDHALRIALGEPGEGLTNWRLTHRQAVAALSVAQRGSDPVVRYAEVAILAALARDDLLATSLRQIYLEPLKRDRDGGETARETLREYFAARLNVSSAAAALGVKRHTVTNRLREIEGKIGRPLSTCHIEFQAALQLDRVDPADPEGAPNSGRY